MGKILRYAGFADEATYNPTEPPASVLDVDIASASLDAPSDVHLPYGGGLGQGVRTHRPGFYAPTGNIVYATDVRTITRMLRWALGGYVFTADGGGVIPDSDPVANWNLHEIYALNERLLPSFTARLGKDHFEHVFSGCVVNSLQLQVSDAYAELTLDVVSAQDRKAELRAIADLNLPDEYPLSFPDVQTRIGANGDDNISAKVRSLTLEIGRNAAADQGRGLGQRFPYRVPVEEREVTLEMDLWYEDTEHLERFWGDEDGATAEGTGEVQFNIDLDAGQDGNVEMIFPRTLYTSVQQQPSGRSEIEQSVGATCFVADVTLDDDTVVESEMLATVRSNEENLAPA